MCQDNEKPVKVDEDNTSFSESQAKESSSAIDEVKVSITPSEDVGFSDRVDSTSMGNSPQAIEHSVGKVLPISFTLLLFLSVVLGYSISRNQSLVPAKHGVSSEIGGFSEIIKGVQQANKPGVAVVKLYGVIQTTSDQSVFGPQRGADSTVAQLKKLGKNKNVDNGLYLHTLMLFHCMCHLKEGTLTVQNANKKFYELHGKLLNSASLSRNNAVLVNLGLIKLSENSQDRRQKDIIFTTVGHKFKSLFNDIPKAKEAI